MAKRKKARTAAQKAATRKMIAANRSRKTKANPAKKRKTPAKKAPIGVRKYQSGATGVVRRGGRKLSPAASTHKRRVESALKGARGKKRTTIYRTRPSGKVTKIIRENPTNRTKAIVSATGGFAVGIIAADVLDRYIATRKQQGMDGTAYGAEAKTKIRAKADGTRIFAQAAGTGVSAVGAYMLREKSVVGTYLLGGMAAGFAAKAFGMIIKDHLMPALLKSDEADSYGKRLGYLEGPRRRGYMGSPRPFQGKPAVIGPQATGSVGSYGCTRVPVNPSHYTKGGRESCKPWPFQHSAAQDCIDKVGRAPHGKMPVVTVPTPTVPGPGDSNGRDPGDGGDFQPPISVQPNAQPPIRVQPAPVPRTPPVRMTPQPLRPNVRLRPIGPSPVDRLRAGQQQRQPVMRPQRPVYDVTPVYDRSDEPR